MSKESINRAQTAKIKNLETKLSLLTRAVKRHPDDDKYHYPIAQALKELAEVTGNREKYVEAEISFNKAIELDNENPFYLIKRAELLIAMGQNQKAFRDLQDATRLAKNILDQPMEDLSIEEMATRYAIQDVTRLEAMRNLLPLPETKVINSELPQDAPNLADEKLSNNNASSNNDITTEVSTHLAGNIAPDEAIYSYFGV